MANFNSGGPPEERHPLSIFFTPRTVAVIGATEEPNAPGRLILSNLVGSPFGGTIFPVNPKRPSVLGIKAYRDLSAVPDKIELAIITTPAASVQGLLQDCAAAGVKGAIVIASDFARGTAGREQERQIVETARQGGIRLIGPASFGLMNARNGLNASMSRAMVRPGNVAFISQSGALCSAVLDWSLQENIGFSAFVSIGSTVDVGWGDLIDYLGYDDGTQSILLYLETIDNARSFLSAARETALSKPIIVLKAGHAEPAWLVASGEALLNDEVVDAAFRRCGVLRVSTVANMFAMAEVLGRQARPRGKRMAIISNAGGPALLAEDTLKVGGGEVAQLTASTIAALDQVHQAGWSRQNPISFKGGANPERYAKTLQHIIADAQVDGVLVILTPQVNSDPVAVAEALASVAKQRGGKPILASWMGGATVAAGETILNRAGIPTFPYPDAAAFAFLTMWRYTDNLRAIYETPTLPEDDVFGAPDREQASRILRLARRSGQTTLSTDQATRLLLAYGLPAVETTLATSEGSAVARAAKLSYPVIMRPQLHYNDDQHLPQIQLAGASAVRQAFRTLAETYGAALKGVLLQPDPGTGYELHVGSQLDPLFGPVLNFGSGGRLGTIFHDRTLALPPLTSTLARRMLERTRIYEVLQQNAEQHGLDLDTLDYLLVRLSQLVVEQREIKQITIDPLLASAGRIIAVDARIELHDPALAIDDLPRTAIQPYPSQYIETWTAKDGSSVTIRPIRPEDEPLMIPFHQSLSEETVYMRYFFPMKLDQRIDHERLQRMCFIDYDREIALVAERPDPVTGEPVVLGVGRLTKITGTNEGEFATLVSDKYQRLGLGTKLLSRLVDIGRDQKFDRVVGTILTENMAMQRVSEKVGFTIRRTLDDVVYAEYRLT
jgi:acetyltransferase